MELVSTLHYTTTTDHKEGEQLEDQRSVGASSCNCGDGTDQSDQSLMFMMMRMMTKIISLSELNKLFKKCFSAHTFILLLLSLMTALQKSKHAGE